MQAALAPRGGDARTILTHFAGSSLDDHRYVAPTFRLNPSTGLSQGRRSAPADKQAPCSPAGSNVAFAVPIQKCERNPKTRLRPGSGTVSLTSELCRRASSSPRLCPCTNRSKVVPPEVSMVQVKSALIIV